jgi:NADH-dependent peroxiredoxin subunit F
MIFLHLNPVSQENVNLDMDGIFVQIRLVPNSHFVKEKLELNPMGEIIIDHHNETSIKGIFATGDVTNVPHKQIVVSTGEGAFDYLIRNS